MSLPGVDVVRNRIEQVKDDDMRFCLMTAYVYAGRISEVIGKACPSDQTVARGPKGNDVRLDTFILREEKEPAVVFTVYTAKRKGLKRLVGLPANYEPWSASLYKYFESFGSDRIFPFTRQKVGQYVHEHKVFEGLTYSIEEYSIYENGKLVKKVSDHERPFTLHALRHLRATELVEFYGFDGFNLAAYGGWTMMTAQAMFGVRSPKVFSRYLYLNWQGYFPKLLKKR